MFKLFPFDFHHYMVEDNEGGGPGGEAPEDQGSSGEGSGEGEGSGSSNDEEDDLNYKMMYEEAQRSLTEKNDLISRQDELIQVAYDSLKNPGKQSGTNQGEQSAQASKNMFGDIDWKKIYDDPSMLESLLEKTYSKAKEDAKSELVVAYSRSQKMAQSQKEAHDMFYSANPDLKGKEEIVQYVGYQVANEHPRWSQDKLFNEIAVRARKRLKELAGGSGSEPPLPFEKGGQGGASQRKSAKKPDEVLSSIDSYMKERQETLRKKMQ